MNKHFICVILTLLSVFAAAQDLYNWDEAEEVQKGVRLLSFKLEEPRLMRVNIMRVDLTTPGLQWISTERDQDWGMPMPDYPALTICSKRIRTLDFLMNARKPLDEGGLNLNVIVAANAAPWTPWVVPFTHKYAHPAGLNITNGKILSNASGFNATFLVTKDGKPDIVSTVEKKDFDKIEMAVSGFALLLKNGEKIEPVGYESGLMPRMCYGLSKDRHYFYIMTIDGRQADWSLGAKGYEMAEFLLKAGAFDAIDMDGGGSTTLCYYSLKDHKPIVVNRVTKNGYTRPVGSNIGIALPGQVLK